MIDFTHTHTHTLDLCSRINASQGLISIEQRLDSEYELSSGKEKIKRSLFSLTHHVKLRQPFPGHDVVHFTR